MSSHFLTLKITDFGPILDGTITTKPLTILMGPNGCGKSHVAELVYAIGKAESTRIYDLSTTSDLEPMDVFRSQAKQILDQMKADSKQTIESDVYKKYIRYIFEVFSNILHDTFLLERKKLIRFGKSRFVLDITSDIINGNIQYSTVDDELKFKERNTKKFKFIFAERTTRRLKFPEKGDIIEIPISPPNIEDEQRQLAEIRFSIRRVFWNMPKNHVVYFPAERGGLTMAQRSLTLHYYNMRGSTHANSPDPNLPGVATNFLGELFMPTRRRSLFAKLALDFEKNALKGTITNKGSSINNALDIIFVQNGKEIPLNVSASSAKDIAALILYLKHTAKPNDVLVLEEPEICLHPSNQRWLARLLARLISADLNLVVTTHSPYFLEQLSHCVMGSTIQNEKRKEILTDDECIEINDVAAYEFILRDGGYKIQRLSVTEDGIPQAEFTTVDDDLYDELVRLRQADG